MAIIVISLDGVGDKEFEKLAQDKENYPNIAKFMEHSVYKGGQKSIFVSNTQPTHTTISTGKLPSEHKIISNKRKVNSIRWSKRAKYINAETIWEAVHRNHMTTAAIFWPVTCGAKIKWNIPGMCIGSRLLQLRMLIKHGWRLIGISQRGAVQTLDNFAAAVSSELLRTRTPDLTLIHLLVYDSTRHKVGGASEELDVARKSLDKNLGKILRAAGERTVLICADHSHLDVEQTVDLRKIFGEELYEQCGGSAFFKKKTEGVENYPWFGRFLTQEEMKVSGYSEFAYCGIAAKKGYEFSKTAYKSNHGYPTDYENYNVFYAIRGAKTNAKANYGDIRDIAGIILKELGIDEWKLPTTKSE